MTARSWLVGLLAALGTAAPAMALAQSSEPAHGANAPGQVFITTAAVDPQRMAVLTGERVTWLNTSIREHTVTSADALFDSDRLRAGGRFSYAFESPGSFAYYCRIHPFIQGEVDVANVLLLAGAGPLIRGDELMLEGRALPREMPVTIERDTGSGFEPVATAALAPDGSFRARLAAGESAIYRAIAGADVSPTVQVDVVPRRALEVSTTRSRRRQLVRVSVTPTLPGAVVHLQRWLKTRFGWWNVRTARLSGAGRATISLPRGSRAPVRVVLRQPDGETSVAVSKIVRLPG